MLVGERVVLRGQRRADVEAEHAAFDGDYAVHALRQASPWQPEPLDAALARFDRQAGEPAGTSTVRITVARRDDAELAWVGSAQVWGLDEHNRTAHLGLTLVAGARGQGFGTETLRLLCDYAFRVRDLHRLGLETLAGNEAMLRAAHRAGFREEGRLRQAAYVLGERVDEVVMGLLREEWRRR